VIVSAPSAGSSPAEIAGEAAAAAAVANLNPQLEVRDTSGAVVPLDLTAAAFFDVDNTMMVGASIFHFARGLAARKFFTTSDLAGFAWQQVKFRIGGKESPDGIAASRGRCRSWQAAASPRSSHSARRSTTS